MRGLSLTQPWATLVAIGAKNLETRSWSTPYRGELLIQAAKKFPKECQFLCFREPFKSVLERAGITSPSQLPTSAIVCVTHLSGVMPTEEMPKLWEMTRRSDPMLAAFERRWQDSHECAFGDYAPGRFAWALTKTKALTTPIPFRGSLGLWSVPQVVLDLVAGQVVL